MTSLRAGKLLTSLLALFALVLLPSVASAHAGLVSANPAADVEITLLPSQLELTFTDQLMSIDGKAVNTLTLTDPTGVAIALTDIAASGSTLSATIPTADYTSGTYTVGYTIVSADGHKLNESYTFTLNAPTLMALPQGGEDEEGEEGELFEEGALPVAIAGAIAIVIAVGGFYIYRSQNRKN